MSASLVHAHEWDTNDTQRFVGLGVGRDMIFSYDYRRNQTQGFRNSGFDTEDIVKTFTYSAVNPGIVGYGLNSGAVFIRELGNITGEASDNPVNASTNSTTNSLLLKQRATRKCNAVSFSPSGNVVATGYDRARNAESLVLWDLHSQDQTPLQNVSTHDAVNCAKFVPSAPHTLVFGGSRMLREYDLRSDTIVSTIPTSLCAQIMFNQHCDLMFATYGDSNAVSIWDRRMLTAAKPDPMLCIPHVFSDSAKMDTRCLRFSLDSSNEFGCLQDGAIIRRWQVSLMYSNFGRGLNTRSSQLTSGLTHGEEMNNSNASSSETNTKTSKTKTAATAKTTPAEEEIIDEEVGTGSCIIPHRTGDIEDWDLFVNKVQDVRTEYDKVVSFDYASNMTTGRLDFVCLRQSGTMFRMPVAEPPASIYLDPFNDFKMVLPPHNMVETAKATHGHLKVSDMCSKEVRFVLENGQPASLPDSQPLSNLSEHGGSSKNSENRSDTDSDNSGEEDEEEGEEGYEGDAGDDDSSADIDYNGEIELKSILLNDIASTMQRRALAGYSLNAAQNIALLSSQVGPQPSSTTSSAPSTSSLPLSAGLLAAWRWIKQQQELTSQSRNYLETPEIDLRYIGVLSVWDGLSEEALAPRLMPKASRSAKTVDDAIKYAVRKSPGSVYVSNDDNLSAYRQLCLRLSGWDFSLSELESRLVALESENQFEKAAGWAAFHDNIERAVECLAKSRKKNLRLMSTAVAGYLVYKDVPTNNVWREQCRKLASELSSPYLRAIFAFVADGSWLDVLDDGSLPLSERLGIALRFLPPKEVGKYLSLLTSRAILNGDLEGIILTGFTPKILPLLQAYLDRSGDIQTVCLLVSFGWPRFFDDPRIPTWFAEYRLLLNSWRYFSQRARLDIARTKLASSGYSHAKQPITAQAFLRCTHCKRLISSGPAQEGDEKRKYHKPRQVWNRCPQCNHALPPCGVCTMPLGPCLDDETESDRWPMFCLKCNHGYHSVHARQWFSRYDVCPVSSCACLCGKATSM